MSNRSDALVFDPHANPLVSIIIPVYNNLDLTLACLASIAANTAGVPYEIIVADDHSTDDSAKTLAAIKHLTLISNPDNLGFLRNCNNAAGYARGKHIVFLNNDTEVCPGWLRAMLDVIEPDPAVGMVGGKLIFTNGKLQEAGGYLTHEGYSEFYGNCEDPKNYKYNFLRPVDVLIGANILIRKDLFFRLGMFDEAYSPAYYEEYDLESKCWDAGFKVMYQPLCEVIHKDNGSYQSQQKRDLSHAHKGLFCDKWADMLRLKTQDTFLARDRCAGKKIILIVDYEVPAYDTHAGSLCMQHYVLLFVRMGFKVIFLPDDLRKAEPYTSELQSHGVEVIYGEFNFDKWLGRNGRYLHYVLLSRPMIADKYINSIIAHTQANIIYFAHDLHYLRELRRYQVDGNPKTLASSQQIEQVELSIFQLSDIVALFSGHEVEILRQRIPDVRAEYIPIFVYPDHELEQHDIEGYGQRSGIAFLGGYLHQPNIDAVLWFVEKIFPIIRKLIPGIKFYMVGSNMPDNIKALECDDIEAIGYISDLKDLLGRIRVFVSPLRYGAGIKGKIITSMIYGTPVVTTGIGAEGLGLKDGEAIMIADEPGDFAAKTAALYGNSEKWAAVASSATKYVRDTFSYEAVSRHIIKLLDILIDDCALCGCPINFSPPKSASELMELQACGHCGASVREVLLARGMLDTLGMQGALHQAIKQKHLKTLLIGVEGPLRRLMEGMSGFTYLADASQCDGEFDLIVAEKWLGQLSDRLKNKGSLIWASADAPPSDREASGLALSVITNRTNDKPHRNLATYIATRNS